MTLSEAQKEFQIRYYLWSISEFEKEIDESSPNLRLFKAGPTGYRRQFMKRLDKGSQLILAHALLKQWHSSAVKLLGESLSNEEDALRNEFYEFCNDSFVREINDKAKKHTENKIKFVSKRKLQEAITKAFNDVFGSQCINSESDYDIEPSSEFDIKCCGWIISTQFLFGRRESKSFIEYTHSIVSETQITHRPDSSNIPDAIKKLKKFKPLVEHLAQNPEFKAPAMRLEQRMSWLCMNRWQYLAKEEVEPACAAAIKFCGRFFDVAPKLLKGLEFDKITP
jgi:hypothetical protein